MARDPYVQKARIHYFSKRAALEDQINKTGGAVVVGKEIRLKKPGSADSLTFSTAKIKIAVCFL